KESSILLGISQIIATLRIKLHLVKSWSTTANVSFLVTTTYLLHSTAATGNP
ncbi:2861_t:CDS:1, partial [Funneliformis geosporum]